MTVAEPIEAMSALFRRHNEVFNRLKKLSPGELSACRAYDASAQAMKAALIADGVRLVPDRSGYFTEGAIE